MAEIIIMPKLGFNMSEGKLVSWYKKEGETITKGEPLFSIETDKTAIDIEATADGVFRKKFLEEGESVEVTLPIAIVGGAEENIDALILEVSRQLKLEMPPKAAAAKQSTHPAAEVVSIEAGTAAKATTPAVSTGKLKITPRARRVAAEQGLSLDGLTFPGTGYQGGICERDVLDFLASSKTKISPVAAKMAAERGLALEEIQGSGVHGKIMKKDLEVVESTVQSVPAAAEVQYSQDGKEILEIVPYAGLRKIIGDRLSHSKFTAPHLYFTQKVNLERLLALRSQVNSAQERKTSVTDYIAKATIIALKKYPDLNESLVGDNIVKYKSVNLGIAVATPAGLIVPVIKSSENMSVVELSKESGRLFEKARSGKLIPDEYSGGTFTISNLGMFGIENFTAIINPPEVGILAVSATKDEPCVVTGPDGGKAVEVKPLMNITLSVDHRVIDGLLAAQFVTEIKRLLENPIELLI